MTMVKLGAGFLFPEHNRVSASTMSFSSQTLDAASEKIGGVFLVPRTGNIRAIRWTTGTVTTGATLDVRLETFDLASANPSGVLWGTNTRNDQVVGASDDFLGFSTKLIADAAVVRGQAICIVISNPASSFGNLLIRAKHTTSNWALSFPFMSIFTTAWSNQAGGFLFGIEYDDGTYEYIDGAWYYSDVGVDTWNNASGTLERGLKFKLPFPTKISGFAAYADFEGVDVKLYDSDGTTVLLSKSFDPGLRTGTSDGVHRYLFDADANLAKDVWYRLIFRPNSVNNVDLTRIIVPTTAAMNCNPGGGNFIWTEGASGSWADTDTKRPLIDLNLSGFDDGTGGGGTNVFVIQNDNPIIYSAPVALPYRP